jgi:hypothetical protein
MSGCCGIGVGVITGVRVEEERVTREDVVVFFGCGRETEVCVFALRAGRFDAAAADIDWTWGTAVFLEYASGADQCSEISRCEFCLTQTTIRHLRSSP